MPATPQRAPTVSAQANALLHRRGVRQLVKFSLVGATSTLIDKGTLWVLLNTVMSRRPWWISATISFALAVTNGFVWNRHWTFRARGHARARQQYSKFVMTNLVGLGLNLALTKAFLVVVTGQLFQFGEHPEANEVVAASICAVPFVVLWNFGASKYWTFRPPE